MPPLFREYGLHTLVAFAGQRKRNVNYLLTPCVDIAYSKYKFYLTTKYLATDMYWVRRKTSGGKMSPIKSFRKERNLSKHELATACGLSEHEISRIEAGKEGIPGELQDYLTKQGANVSELASEQSAFIADSDKGSRKSA